MLIQLGTSKRFLCGNIISLVEPDMCSLGFLRVLMRDPAMYASYHSFHARIACYFRVLAVSN